MSGLFDAAFNGVFKVILFVIFETLQWVLISLA